MRQATRYSGFTMFEMMIVVGIIALMAGALLGIPWSNLTKYAKASGIDQVETAASSARMVALEHGRRAAVIIAQSDQVDAASMIVVVESDNPGVFYNVDGAAWTQLPRGTTARAPALTDTAAFSLYETNTSAGTDNVVADPTAAGGVKHVKCFAVAFDSQGELIVNGSITWFDGNRDGIKLAGANLQYTDLQNIPFAPYAAIIDTRALVDAKALCFANGQVAENNFILANPAKAKTIAFNRYSGNALRK